MDQATLVREQAEGGERLLRRLVERGFGVRAAVWAPEADTGRWVLHVVAPVVEQSGPLAGYEQMADALGELDPLWSGPLERIDPFAIRLIGPGHPLAVHVLDLYRRHPGLFPRFTGGAVAGPEYYERLYVYPPALFQPRPPAGVA